MSDNQKLITIVQQFGSDAQDVRDAAHEACHAIDCYVPEGDWDRETIHQHVLDKYLSAGEWVAAEVFARAVEWRVCEKLSIPYDLDNWAMISFMETFKNMNLMTPADFWAPAIETVYKRSKSVRLAEEVLHLCQM